MKDITFYTGVEKIQAEAFKSIARFVHSVYDNMDSKGITGEEGYILGIVETTESLVDALIKKDEL